MIIIFLISLFYTLYGIAGLFGFQRIDEKFKNRPWTKAYIRGLGISWIITGVPWLMLYFSTRQICMDRLYLITLYIGAVVPSFIYTIFHERKYNALLKQDSNIE